MSIKCATAQPFYDCTMKAACALVRWTGIALGCLTLVGYRASAANTPPFTLANDAIELRLWPDDGRFEINDRSGGVTWSSNPFQGRFGQLTFIAEGKKQQANLEKCDIRRALNGLEATFEPVPGNGSLWLKVWIRFGTDPRTLEVSYRPASQLAIESVQLLDEALWVSDSEQGYVTVPVREGLLVPADSGLQFRHRFDTFAYEGCHMEMLGVVKSGAAALVTWDDPYVAVDLRSILTNAASFTGKQVLAPSLVLRKSAASFRIQFLGKGDYLTIGRAYRKLAQDKGLLIPWDQKLKHRPECAKLFGAINFKLWSALDRSMNEDSTREERVRVNWTFDEAVQVAEHLKRDLQLDKVLFVMGGWIHRGYDNQHPDILPTAPECGGDSAFVDCARRVQALGYLFCLHDNYQDIYRDSP
jgi:hypothetical protein